MATDTAFGSTSRVSGPARERISGSVERVTFHNPDTGFCVLRLKVRGQRDLVTLTGHAAAIGAGEYVEADGVWLNDRNHGLQFKAERVEATVPTTLQGLEKYLGSGMIKGIGPVYAAKLVGAFGHEVFDVIESRPERLREVTGIGPVREAKIIRGWSDQRAIREIIVWLYSHGVSSARAVRIFKTYGQEAIAVIKADPYRLARDIAGIGFKTADAIASSIGYGKEDPRRVRAGVAHALTSAMDDGHCGLPRDELIRSGAKLLEVTEPLIERALEGELASGEVMAGVTDGREVMFLAGLYRAEQSIAERLLRLRAGRLPWPAIDAGQAIPWVERKTGLELSPSQRDALRLALVSKACVITGGPGVGKTTLVNSILKSLAAKRVAIALAAPTGRAAKRLSESSGMEAMTLHRLLETDPAEGGFKRDEHNPLDCQLLVIDEASMVDVMLMHATMKALPSDAALLLVGDVDQLPSVGAGQVLKDVIASGAVPVVRLTEVFRQAATSRIIVNAHRINAGEMPDLTARGEGDFFYVEADEPGDVADRVLDLVSRHIPRRFGFDPARNIQVLGPMQRGGAGARALNTLLQQRLNPPTDQFVERFGHRYGPGDKVMHIVNDRERDIYNGDLGVVTKVDHNESEFTATFGQTEATFDFGELDALQLAYATTIHKSQGSEYPVVVLPLTMQAYTMLGRELIYTAVTRARKLLVAGGLAQGAVDRGQTTPAAALVAAARAPVEVASSARSVKVRQPQPLHDHMRQLPSRLRRLNDALSDLPLDEPMLLTELDGFLTGVLVCPDLIMPGEWLQNVWGSDEGGVAAFDDPADVQWFADAVVARYSEIARDLGRGKPQPIFDIDERNGDVLWELWIDGFAEAMELRPDSWAALGDGDKADAAGALSRISTLVAVARNESELDSVQINALQDHAPSDLMDAVLQLHAARLQIGGSPPTSPINARPTKVGRNEPCHCGSGKKFKRCCA